MMHGFGFGFGGWGMLIMLLFWVGIVALSSWVVKGIFFGRSGRGTSDAKALLDQRYARGEIKRKEYEQMKKDLAK